MSDQAQSHPADRPEPSASADPGRPGPSAVGSSARRRVLILGGTGEARALAGTLADVTVISSLAGRTSSPLLPAGEVRVGGFGGARGLADYLRAERIDVLVDATHPFAARISDNAGMASATTGVPLVVLRRPGWTEQPGDAWYRVPDLGEAAALLPQLGHRVFLTTGRQGIAAFAEVDAWFLTRSVEPPEPPMPHRIEVLLDRGPFTLDGERRLLAEHQIDVLVSKDSGGTGAKLVAARERGLPVVMVDRPPAPTTAHAVASVTEAVEQVMSLGSRGNTRPGSGSGRGADPSGVPRHRQQDQTGGRRTQPTTGFQPLGEAGEIRVRLGLGQQGAQKRGYQGRVAAEDTQVEERVGGSQLAPPEARSTSDHETELPELADRRAHPN